MDTIWQFASASLAHPLLSPENCWDTRVLTVASPGYLKKHGHPADPQQLVADRHLMIDFRDAETGRPLRVGIP